MKVLGQVALILAVVGCLAGWSYDQSSVATDDLDNTSEVSVEVATPQSTALPAGEQTTLPDGEHAAPMSGCLSCSKSSTGACDPGGKSRVQCRGSRKDCKSKGCKITGTGSCSSAANVKIC